MISSDIKVFKSSFLEKSSAPTEFYTIIINKITLVLQNYTFDKAREVQRKSYFHKDIKTETELVVLESTTRLYYDKQKNKILIYNERSKFTEFIIIIKSKLNKLKQFFTNRMFKR